MNKTNVRTFVGVGLFALAMFLVAKIVFSQVTNCRWPNTCAQIVGPCSWPRVCMGQFEVCLWPRSCSK